MEDQFQVTYLSGRVSPDGVRDSGPEFDHLILEVSLDGPWLVDVGFGEGFSEPLPLVPGEWDSDGQRFRMERRGEAWALSMRQADGAWKLLYVFSRLPRRLEEFSGMCRYHQTSPDSFFLKNRLCTRKTSTGRVTVSGQRLIVSDAGRREELPLGTEEAVEQALLEHFGIPRGALERAPEPARVI